MRILFECLVLATLLIRTPSLAAQKPDESLPWPTLRGDSGRGGYTEGQLKAPGAVAWSVAFDGERIGTAVEPIVGGGRVFIPTHAGAVWALDAATGKPLWRFATAGPVLHSPVLYRSLMAEGPELFIADAAGVVYCVDPATGKPRWTAVLPGESFAASPTACWVHRITDLLVIGSRSGTVLGIEIETGKVLWRTPVGAPVRQTAAVSSAHELAGAYLMSEDLRLHCLGTFVGKEKWMSSPLPGQSARDYYPVIRIGKDKEPGSVFVRTSPRTQFSRRIAADLKVLCASAGIDSAGWKPIDAWTKDAARNLGTPELWEKERAAVFAHLAADPDAATLFVFDAERGRPLPTPPVFWAGGCQGVPAPPALTERGPTGKMSTGPAVIEYRTAYGNWRSLYWISGSRVFRVDCDGVKKPNPPAVVHRARDVQSVAAQSVPPDPTRLAAMLDQQVAELIGREWAPFACVPGLAGTERAFTQSGEVIEALAWAFPHLAADRQAKVKSYVADLIKLHPPFSPQMWFDPAKGERREYAPPAAEALKPRGDDVKLHPFGNAHVLKLWSDRTGDRQLLLDLRPQARAALEDFLKSKWSLDPDKGHLHANRYLASLIAYNETGGALDNHPMSAQAVDLAAATAANLAKWWKRAAAEQRAMAGIDGVAKLDQFIGKGAGVFHRLIPHRHKLALFKDLTPEVLAAVRKLEPEAPKQAWEAFVAVAPTWYLVGEERQVHYGENAYDPPDFSLDAFRAAKWIGEAKGDDLARYADQPWGRADVYFIQKAAMSLDPR